MSHWSPGHDIATGWDNLVTNLSHTFGPPKQPKLQTASAPPMPNQAQTAQQMQEQEFNVERQQATSSTVLTGGQGLMDSPTTTSQLLLGS